MPKKKKKGKKAAALDSAQSANPRLDAAEKALQAVRDVKLGPNHSAEERLAYSGLPATERPSAAFDGRRSSGPLLKDFVWPRR